MFRFTIREMLLATALVGTFIGWWIDHRANAEAAEDARMLAHFSANGPHCGNEAGWFMQLQEKYGARRIEWAEIMALPEDESALGGNVAP